MHPDPTTIKRDSRYRLIAKVHHDRIKSFIIDQLSEKSALARLFMGLQLAMLVFLGFLIGYSVMMAVRGSMDSLERLLAAALFSFTIMVVVHELLHAIAFLLQGITNISFGADIWKFIFYVQADGVVMTEKQFKRVAWTPFFVVTLTGLVVGTVFLFTGLSPVFWYTLTAIHVFFCTGDIGMICLYQNHKGKRIITFDMKAERTSYFYEELG